MSLEDNKAISRRYFGEVFSQGKLDVVDELFTPDHSNTGPAVFPGLPDGPAGIKMLVTAYRDAFPDVKFAIDEQIAEGNKVVTRWTATGTPKGDARDVPMPDSVKTSTGVTINRFVDGMISESWAIFDQFGLMQQLGIIPTTD